MSVLESILEALEDVVSIGGGEYPNGVSDPCGKIIFTGKDRPTYFMGGGEIGIETFKVVFRGSDYGKLEEKASSAKDKLRAAGFIQMGGYEDVESKAGETFMQLAVNFKKII